MKQRLGVFVLAMINVAAICNIKNFPLMAEYGLSTVTFLLLATLFFFLPVSLVSAELATGWSDRGIYTWVKAAMGPKWAFLAVWLQWIENVIWYPTILTFIATTLAYVFDPALANNSAYTVSVILVVYWLFTFLNFRGMHLSGWISTLSVLLGTIIPIGLIIILGLSWILGDRPTQIPLTWGALIPSFTSITQLVLLAGFFLGLAGMEMSAVHARDVENPRRDYPKAIFLSTVLIVILSSLGSVAIAAVVPQKQLQLTSGGMEAFTYLFNAIGIPWAIPLIAAVTAFGAMGMMSTWMVGPSRSLFATALDGDLPPYFQKSNKEGMPVGIMIAQGLIVTVLSLIFLFMPSVNTSYWILFALAAELYMLMYLLLFIAGIRLRYTHPHVARAYSVPGGKLGMWLITGVGFAGTLFAIVVGLFPPSQLDTGKLLTYEAVLIGGTALFCIIPFIIYAARHPSWKPNKR